MANFIRNALGPATLVVAVFAMHSLAGGGTVAIDLADPARRMRRTNAIVADIFLSRRPIAPPANAPPAAGADSNAGSINGLADQRFNQMITNRVLGNVLLGVNEQVNCNDCISAFGSAGSFSAGIHGRKNLTPNLSLLAGIAYAHYNEGGYHVTSSPIGAFALRYDFVDWGSSRPFFDIGTILSPFQKVRYARSYTTSLGAVSLEVRLRAKTMPSMAAPAG